MMDDLISRQDVLDICMKYCSDDDGSCSEPHTDLREMLDEIEYLPSEQQWIPCSERLPDQNGKYLVVGRQKAINILKFDDGRWYGKWGVLAWRPLPAPYREETES